MHTEAPKHQERPKLIISDDVTDSTMPTEEQKRRSEWYERVFPTQIEIPNAMTMTDL